MPDSSHLSPDIPLPHLTGEPRYVKVRPCLLGWVTLSLAVQNLTAWIVFLPNPKHQMALLVIASVMRFAGLIAQWGMWQGRRWARWMMLIGACVLISHARVLPHETWAERGLNCLGIAMGFFLLWWLNTRSVVAFFRTEGNAVSLKDEKYETNF